MHVHNLDIFSRFSLTLVYHRKDSLSSIFLPTFVPPGTLARPKRTVPAALFLPTKHYCEDVWQVDPCQCPLELVPHSTPFDIFRTFVHTLLTVPGTSVDGLVPHFYGILIMNIPIEELLCQCPLGLVPHFYSSISRFQL